MTAADTPAASTPAGTGQPVVRSKGELVSRLISPRISCFEAGNLAGLEEGDQYTIGLGNHVCGGRALDGPRHDLSIIAVVGGWWLLLPVPGGETCLAVARDGKHASRPLSSDRVPQP
jgi:hypothetical protein